VFIKQLSFNIFQRGVMRFWKNTLPKLLIEQFCHSKVGNEASRFWHTHRIAATASNQYRPSAATWSCFAHHGQDNKFRFLPLCRSSSKSATVTCCPGSPNNQRSNPSLLQAIQRLGVITHLAYDKFSELHWVSKSTLGWFLTPFLSMHSMASFSLTWKAR